MPFSKLNETNDFKSETNLAYANVGEQGYFCRNILDHLKFRIGMKINIALFILYLLCLPYICSASAWLVKPGNNKFITSIENKKFSILNDSDKDWFFQYNEIYFKNYYERGWFENLSLIANLSFFRPLQYNYYYKNHDNELVTFKKSSDLSMPTYFNHFSLGPKFKLYENKYYVISHEAKINFYRRNRSSFTHSINFGKSGKIYRKQYFLDAEIGLEKNIKYMPDSQFFNISVGISKSSKSTFMLQLFNYRQSEYYDLFSKTNIDLGKTYYEHNLCLSHIKKLNKFFRFQQGIFHSLNKRKTLRSYGVIFSIWYES